jgi:Neocarzinostatin family
MFLVAGLLAIAACSSNGSTTAAQAPPTPAPTTPAPTTPAGPSQTLTITPHAGLHDKQLVKIVGTGFKAGKQYGVTECANKGAATGAGDCNLRGIKVAVADASGRVTVNGYQVLKGPFGSNNVNCAKSPYCIVSVSNAGSATPTEVGSADIRFAA